MKNSVNESIINVIFSLGKLMRSHLLSDGKVSELTFIQMEALVFLKSHEMVSMREIAKQFHIKMPTATALIDKLEDLHLIERKNDKTDRRVVLIQLTQKGKTLLQHAMKKRQQHITTILENISVKEKELLCSLLEKLLQKAKEEYEEE